MPNKFIYDHSMLSMERLHKIGIRSTTEIEEVIEGYSFADEAYFGELKRRVIRFIGFSKSMRILKVAASFDTKEEKLYTLNAITPTVEDVIDEFCRFAIMNRQ